ncbi:MAG: hypothetical protein NZ700_08475 [Gemmataceae bacterium]|nr:hypothetical protein [Gemmataceae bacterium]MDW8266566.1 hypothetical protein [Gemmataceae bacterium]
MIDPHGLGLCSQCGYCRSLAEAPLPTAKSSEEPEPWRHVPRPPRPWLPWVSEIAVCLFGIGVMVGVSIYAHYRLPETGPERARWSALQFVLGLVALCGAQIWAVVIGCRLDDRLGARDLFLPRVWLLTVRRLPETGPPVCLVLWALTLVATAAFVVGGLTWELRSVVERIEEIYQIYFGSGARP